MYIPKMQIEKYVTFDLDAENLGEEISTANSDFTAAFLDSLGDKLKSWDTSKHEQQLSCIAGDLGEDGIWFIRRMADHITEHEKES